ncbi:hypothetical protein KKE92_04765 [Candidatus Micrarchaeota archaeon]|nr:hypothetical protein [Candidatus Micrarchaeota archaeon]
MHKQKRVNGSSKVRFRKVPELEKVQIDRLTGCTSEPWKRIGFPFPPCSALAHMFVYGNTFLGIKKLPGFFQNLLENAVLLDLGAGDPRPMVDFALACGVRLYLGVDLYLSYKNMSFEDPRIVLENNDMLQYVAKMPDNSASVFLGAIDEIVLAHNKSKQMEIEYESLLLSHIHRVVPPDGLVFGVNSHLFPKLEKMGFERIDRVGKFKISHDAGTAVLQKIE